MLTTIKKTKINTSSAQTHDIKQNIKKLLISRILIFNVTWTSLLEDESTKTKTWWKSELY